MISAEQKTYITTKEAYENVEQHISTLMDATMGIPEANDENGIDLYCQIEEQFRTNLKAYEIHDALRNAENALIAWGQEQAKTVKEYRMFSGLLDAMFSKIDKMPTIRQRVIALIMKLDVSPTTTQGKRVA